MMNLLLLVVGFALLIAGAHFLVEGAAGLARRFGLSELMIGLTVVAFGTSTPELVVSVLAAARGTTSIAVGNVLGSNTANILLILGAAALIRPLAVAASTVWKEIPVSFLAAVVVAVLGNDAWIDGRGESVLDRTDGLALLGFFAVFLYYVAGMTRAGGEQAETSPAPPTGPTGGVARIVGGLVALVGGGHLVVASAVVLARSWGVSEMTIGVTIVAIGTSLPELATSLVAARKGKVDIAVGNVVGSCIFNVFLILGASAVVAPLPIQPADNVDLGATLLAGGLLFLFMFTGRPRHLLDRREGAVCLTIYAAYLAYQAIRQPP